MGKVILGLTMSLDGFINDRSGDVGSLYPDLEALGKTELLQESIRNTGAVVMGRNAYDMAKGDFTGHEYQVPVFVVTHHPPAKAAKGENENFRFNFVTDGVISAIDRAKIAAGSRNVTVIGGANLAQQIIKARLFDELEIGITPILLGGGLRLFETGAGQPVHLEKLKVIETFGRTDLIFRLIP
jgi:dihydrofolate reductase